jgi:hypothetical protein
MKPDNSIPDPAKESAASPAPACARSHPLARAALVLSIFAFVPPLGIAAIVMGHIAERRSSSSSPNSSPQNGNPRNERSVARAALWIAYIQTLFVLSATLILWTAFRQTALGFQRDALVQSVFRSSDRLQPLDPSSAGDAERTARAILTQLIATEDQYRRHSDTGLYACRVYDLIEGGLEGTTEAEKRAFYQRVADSPYTFEISGCNPPKGDWKGPDSKDQDAKDGDTNEAAYFLTAVPRRPPMPEWSAIYCADQTGAVRQVRRGTSLDCLKNGDRLP